MPPESQPNVPQSPILKVNGKATTSLVLGIIGLIAWFIPLFGFPITVVGLVMGIKGLDSTKKTRATVGIILCVIGLVLTTANAVIGAYMGATGQHLLVNEILDK